MTRSNTPKWLNAFAWPLQGLAAAAFIAAATAKLAAAPMMVELYEQIGVGQWFRYITAAVEIIGAVALLVPRSAPLGALLLAATMMGAVITHVFVVHSSPAGALVLLGVVLAIAWIRRDLLPLRRNGVATEPAKIG